MAPGQHTFEVRAIDMAEAVFENPGGPNPNFEGNVDPTPATHTWTMTADTTPPSTGSPPPAGEDRPREPARSGDPGHPGAPVRAPGCRLHGHRQRDAAARADVRVPARLRPVGAVRVARVPRGPRDRAAHLPHPGGRPRAQRRPDADRGRVRGRGAAGDDVHCRRRRSSAQRDRGLHVHRGPARVDVRVLASTTPSGHRAPRRRCSSRSRTARTVPGPRDQPRARDRGPAGPLRVGGRARPRRDAAGHADPHRAARVTQERIAEFTFEATDNRPGDLAFQCALDGAQWRRATRRHRVRRPHAAGAHAARPRPRRLGQLGSDAGQLDVERQGAARHDDPLRARADEITESTDATFTFEANTPGSTYWCWLDGVLDQNLHLAEDATRASPAARTSSPSSRRIRTGSGSSSGPSTSGRSATSTRRSR